MVRIGRIVDFTGNREVLTEKILLAISKQTPIEPINWSFVDDNTMHIYGDSADLTDLKTFLEGKGFTFTINGAAPAEPTPDPEDPPTQDELDALQFFKDAFNAEFASMETTILAAIKVRYDLANTTPIAFEDVPKTDIKHLRQRI